MRTSRGLESMRYEDSWKVLADLIAELRRKGEPIPENIMNDLRSAKTMVHILQANQSHLENVERIETYLGNVEFYAISTTQERFGAAFVEQWMKKLGKAKEKIMEGKEIKGVSRFVPGIPRGKCWVRIKPSQDFPKETIQKFAEENRLSHKTQSNGFVLTYGKEENVKTFMDKLRMQQKQLRKRKQKGRPTN
ncbi:MAG: DUF2096 family protein [Candidatus Bathyarchaeota archaeon]|nr:MAG: DUF2096 family protein [Candidatus Bathyarchaeota archaeon]